MEQTLLTLILRLRNRKNKKVVRYHIGGVIMLIKAKIIEEYLALV